MNRSRLPIILLLLVALVATGFTRQLAATRRNANRVLGSEAGTATQLSRMNSFALALLLGGLRGPLVMILWTSSETQKSDRNLDDFDTKVEWIRLLQPEFDSVHIFQMWNKAYNISVQMASLANKYLTIIDSIDYGQRVNHERPNNINIIYQIGSVYGDKLGDSAEKAYYSKRVREESRPHASRQKLATSDPGYRRLELDPVLDDKGNVLEQYLKPTNVRLVDPAEPNDVYDGSDLPFLKRFEPYPYGVGPFGFAYNYRKRAQLLQRLGNQKHAQLSDLVVDSRPALDLKKWGEAEWDHGRRCEIRALGKQMPTERYELENVTSDVAPAFATGTTLPADRLALLREAESAYDLADRVWAAADVEYVTHLRHYKQNITTYQSHRDELGAQRALLQADRDYIKAMLAPAADRQALLANARTEYRRATVLYAAIILRYYVKDPEVAAKNFPPDFTAAKLAEISANPDSVDPHQLLTILGASLQMMEQRQSRLEDEIGEYLAMIRRADTRLKQLPQ